MPMTKVLAFLVVLGVLVVFHELGHYWVARWCGVKVLRFSVGFGRVVWSRRFGPDRTEWAVSAVPLGGYVKMVDEREGDVARERPRARVQPAERLEANRHRRRRADREPAARRAALRRHLHRRHSRRSARCSPRRRRTRRRRRRASATAISSSRPTARRCGAGRTCAGASCGRPARATITIDVERPDGARLQRTVSLASLAGADWEGNFMPALGFRTDLGAPLIDEVLARQARGARGTAGGGSHPRHRRRAGPLARRGRRADQREAGRGA